ncbi:outer membrane beta-barrel protein [Cysteiniphilum marinum]|uniref:outer membrane beta-barrel protein n=1 Tax=Cysteiniphilum marinum TaxID=2774191 RepID=UPI00193B4EBC|nr:outer membrane beta-barrel protein [Cysteiniphilum marinum]
MIFKATTFSSLILALSILTGTQAFAYSAYGEYLGGAVGGDFTVSSEVDNQAFVQGVLGYGFEYGLGLQVTGSLSSDIQNVMLEGIYTLPIGKTVSPYLAVGLGYLYFDSKSMFAAQLGFGLTIRLTEHWNMGVDYRFLMGFSDSSDVNITSGSQQINVTSKHDNPKVNQLGISFTYYFDSTNDECVFCKTYEAYSNPNYNNNLPFLVTN